MTFLLLDGKKINVEASRFKVEKRLAELSLVEYIKQAWHVVEPGADYVHNWHIDMICAHLTAITDEMVIDYDDEERELYYNRLLINLSLIHI